MKKFIFLLGLTFMLTGVQTFAAPQNHGRPPLQGRVSHRPPVHHIRVARPLPPPIYYRPYHANYYYTMPVSYTYYSYEPAYGQTVIIREGYSGVNTAANVINAAANVATAIRLLTW